MKVVADSRDRDAWLAARQRYVCGSETAAMLEEGRGDNNTRAQLVMAKAGLVEPWAGNETTRHGMYLEHDYFPRAARAEFGWQLEFCGLLIEDPACPQLAATPDYMMETPFGTALVQAKVTTASAQEDVRPRKDGKPSEAVYANGAPLAYQLQIQAELAVTGLQWVALLVLHAAGGALKLRAYCVRRHDGVIARIRAEAPRVMADAMALKAGQIVRVA